MRLSDKERATIRTDLVREASVEREALALIRSDDAEAIAAIDEWWVRAFTELRGELPEPARTKMTNRQLVRRVRAVIRRHWENN